MSLILHVTEDHSELNTGITNAVNTLAGQLRGKISQQICCTGVDAVPVPEGVSLHSIPLDGYGRAWRMPAHSRQSLTELIKNACVVHIHGLWMWIQWSAAVSARRLGKPLVISPHGMLEPWIWTRQNQLNQQKKRIYWKLLAYPAFRSAKLIHAVTEREAANLRSFFPGQRIETIPHGIDIDAIDQMPPAVGGPIPESSCYILFVGRLHPVKAIDQLILAYAQLGKTGLSLKIAGPVEKRESVYADSLKNLVKRLGLENRVEFLGPVSGVKKWSLYRDAWVCCQPSYSEVISLVNLEAAACRVPVITSLASGISPAWEENGGIFVNPEVSSISAALAQADQWSTSERKQRGESLYQFVLQHYNWSFLRQRWESVYEQIGEM